MELREQVAGNVRVALQRVEAAAASGGRRSQLQLGRDAGRGEGAGEVGLEVAEALLPKVGEPAARGGGRAGCTAVPLSGSTELREERARHVRVVLGDAVAVAASRWRRGNRLHARNAGGVAVGAGDVGLQVAELPLAQVGETLANARVRAGGAAPVRGGEAELGKEITGNVRALLGRVVAPAAARRGWNRPGRLRWDVAQARVARNRGCGADPVGTSPHFATAALVVLDALASREGCALGPACLLGHQSSEELVEGRPVVRRVGSSASPVDASVHRFEVPFTPRSCKSHQQSCRSQGQARSPRTGSHGAAGRATAG
mmetsp:Transcript_91223/g.295062  ORF Transcript_91223/g.295062 Transcript_91223/m.295062 type:complete len:316 (+) Transcript_91223:588-1535(+)